MSLRQWLCYAGDPELQRQDGRLLREPWLQAGGGQRQLHVYQTLKKLCEQSPKLFSTIPLPFVT
jgi:hypothetical protein